MSAHVFSANDTAKLSKLLEENMIEKFQYISELFPQSMASKTASHIHLTNSRIHSSKYNTVFGSPKSKQQFDTISGYFQNENQPFSWWLNPHNSTQRSLRQAHHYFHSQSPCQFKPHQGFVHHLKKNLVLQPNSRLDIKPCHHTHAFEHFSDVLSSTSPTDMHAIHQLFKAIGNLPYMARNRMEYFVGYCNGNPVVTGSLFKTDVAGLYDIATTPIARNLGFGSAMLRFLLQHARDHGYEQAVLHCDAKHTELYVQHQFEEICPLQEWQFELHQRLQQHPR
jgi:ribosomal protein S18 acetylase RimI-like enzyme